MKLYLLRHGEATPMVGEQVSPDRSLNETGREQCKKTAEEIRTKGINFDVILTSPYLRAFQTAEIVADALGIKDRLAKEPLLAPGFDFFELMELMEDYYDRQSILLVGHEPDLGEVAGQLLCLDGPRPLNKAEMVEIEIQNS